MTPPKATVSASMRRLCVAAWFMAGLGSALGQTSLVANSPFAPAGTAGSAGADSMEAYELAGSSIQGSDIEVCVYNRQAKRSEWIAVGGVSGGIHVISYDPEHDRAVVTIAGARKELGLRKHSVAQSSVAISAPVSRPVQQTNEVVASPSPIVAPSSEVPTAAAHDQNEARMLVSDLLEIGVQQRKAYQDAKQKSASDATAQPAN